MVPLYIPLSGANITKMSELLFQTYTLTGVPGHKDFTGTKTEGNSSPYRDCPLRCTREIL